MKARKCFYKSQQSYIYTRLRIKRGCYERGTSLSRVILLHVINYISLHPIYIFIRITYIVPKEHNITTIACFMVKKQPYVACSMNW